MRIVVTVVLLAWAGPADAQERRSPIFQPQLNAPGRPLRGFTDLHTHPMSHLGFGGHLIHGAPDVGVLMAPGTIYDPRGQGLCGTTCNLDMRPAGSVAEALGTSYSTHGNWDALRNKCGSLVRSMVMTQIARDNGIRSLQVDAPQGWPTFADFPAANDFLHTQMWVDWIKRAKEGGLRVMVGLAVNNRTLAHGIDAPEPVDDQASGDLQVRELIRFVGRHGDWMEIAYSASDVRRIVQQDRMAVVVGVELDDIGNFAWNRKPPTDAQVQAEIQRLHREGVRYVFPIHITDNFFGGAAVYEREFARANRFETGKDWSLECSPGIGTDIRVGFDLFRTLRLGAAGGDFQPPRCPPGEGHRNRLGLTGPGRVAIRELMRLGMLIDVDHMSRYAVQDTLAFTRLGVGQGYPVVSGHNGLAGPGGSENSRTVSQYQEIAARGGMAGIGFGATSAKNFAISASAVAAITGEGRPVQISLGSDVNGVVALPRSPECRRSGVDRTARAAPACVDYSRFPMATMGSRSWDYNEEGVVHIGLFPDFLEHVESLPGGERLVDQLFDGAEGFARMWEAAAALSRTIP